MATCKYCGFTVVIETGQVFTFEHSMLVNRFDSVQIEESIRGWMQEGFLKPSDLARKSKTIEKNLTYLPFWVITAKAESSYKGIFERITPAVTKEGHVQKEYSWLVLARKAAEFPTRDYEVPLEGKIPYDFRKIESYAKVLNSEIDQAGAVVIAEQEIEENHRFLIQEDVDKIVEMKTEFEIRQVVYMHCPVWFSKYEYKNKDYQLLIDGATGNVIKGDIPSGGFGML